ncbi:hypothetical protein PRIPAC_95862 [Pristionchus pacificus]|uniref:Uncharacterized protein n=1 Tax=Pristionchus pacificus TaxID=54126 RepID=A0A2A6D3K3_PRIPA|nr:hypothetical protein PRIPAC_95862 [Pristionchus pacificus]|eukprot:PDM84841.1 hypothetical protein PRIPAC_33864 [Pristionchus pacificus]
MHGGIVKEQCDVFFQQDVFPRDVRGGGETVHVYVRTTHPFALNEVTTVGSNRSSISLSIEYLIWNERGGGMAAGDVGMHASIDDRKEKSSRSSSFMC